jgi:hypothetical protein
LFDEVAERLDFYPWRVRPAVAERALGQGSQAGAVFLLTPAREPAHPRFLQVVRGVTYPRRSDLPVDTICLDPQGRPDLGLNTIPDSARKAELESAARLLFEDILRQSLEGASTCTLDPRSLTEGLPLFATYLAYAVQQTPLAAAAKVSFADATGRFWTAAELLEFYQRDGRLMIVPSQPAPDVPPGQRSDRPVLLWGGQAEQIGRQLFPTVTSGAGYLYSLAVNEQERHRDSALGEPRLASRTVDSGRLSLLPWGDPDRPAEVEFVGPRRARETFHLDADAPKGLRLVWESDQSPEQDLRELVLDGTQRQVVLELIDASLATTMPSRESLLAALSWALSKGAVDWSGLARMGGVPLLEDVGNNLVSVHQLLDWEQQRGVLPVLSDRSTSLPRALPIEPLVWWHPLLEGLGIQTEDAGRQVREANWREIGRERWLASHPPAQPDWPPHAAPFGPHLGAKSSEPDAPTEVGFWREGRPFGRRTLPRGQCPPGCLIMWVDDHMPGDTYWSGPESSALSDRLPAIAELCRKIQEAP